MPRISSFFGIVILMYWDDHALPHFHARCAEHKASIGLDPLCLLAGSLPPRALGQVFEWAALHEDQLREDWELVRNRRAPLPIEPLA